MDKIVTNYDKLKQKDNRTFFWYARDIWQLMGYREWRNFLKVILKAKKLTEEEHFQKIERVVDTYNNAKRTIIDYKLTGYACYLIAVCGDIKKDSVRDAMMYFKKYFDF